MGQTPLAAQVSVFDGSTNTIPFDTIQLSVVLQRIQSGTYQQDVERLRHILTTQGKASYNQAKRRSMGFTPAGVFAKRANAQLTTPSECLNYDFDHVPNLADAKARLIQDPWIVYVFDSPSGVGLKMSVWASGIVDDASYKHAWNTVLEYFKRTYPDIVVANDKSCKDISRLCYVSWDPALYSNPDPRLFVVDHYQPPTPTPTASSAPPQPTNGSVPADADRQRHAQQAIETATRMIDASIPPTATTAGTRHPARLKASRLLGGYVAGNILSYTEASAALKAAVTRNTDDIVRSIKTIIDGLAYGQQAAITE